MESTCVTVTKPLVLLAVGDGSTPAPNGAVFFNVLLVDAAVVAGAATTGGVDAFSALLVFATFALLVTSFVLLVSTPFALLVVCAATANRTPVLRENAALPPPRSGATGLAESAWGRERGVVAPPHEVDAAGRSEEREMVTGRREMEKKGTELMKESS